jgi:hypothetical protein
MLKRVVTKKAKYLIMSSVLFLIAIRLVRPNVRDKDDLKLGSTLIGGMAIAASLPYIVAFPAYLGDSFAVWVAMIPTLLLTTAWGSWPMIFGHVHRDP